MDLREAIDEWLSRVNSRDDRAEKKAQVIPPQDTSQNDDPDPVMPDGRLLIDGRATRHAILDTVKEAVSKRFPVENDNYRIELSDVGYEGPTHYTLEQQKNALLHNRKLGCSLAGTWRLIDRKTGKVIDQRHDAVMRVPYYTNRGTVIHNGSEYTVINQARLSPGVYVRRKQNGDIETQFNVANGRGFHLELDKASGRMNIKMGQANIPLYPILKAWGYDDKAIGKAWGNDVALANAQKNDPKTLQRFYDKVAGFKADPLATDQMRADYLKNELSTFGLDPDTVVRTLGIEGCKGVTPEAILRASQKMLNVNRGIEEPDSRDNPRFSKFYGIEHMLGERIEKDAAKLLKPMLFKAGRDKSLQRIGRNALGPYIDDFLSTSGLAQPGEEANPMSILIQQARITRLGQGGISSPDLVTPEARGVQGDYLGFVDPISGPESMSAGVDLRAAYGAVIGKDHRLYNIFRNLKTGKKEYLSVDSAADHTIAFPDQDPKAPFMYAMKNGVPTRVKTSEVDYMVPSFSRMMGAGIDMNPLPTAVFGMRNFYSSKFWEQYLPQKQGEVPFVDSLMPDGKMTFNEYYGRRAGCVTAPFAGTVTSVTKDGITITGKDGKKKTLDLVTNLPYNRMTQLSLFSTVKKGQEVKEGDILANSNFTDPKTGAFNMGHNLKVAILPGCRGANSFEDAVIISEDAARKMSTSRMYNFEQDTKNGVSIGKNKFLAAFPSVFTKQQAETLDDNGVVKVGTELHRGDPIMVATGPKMLSAENAQLGKLSSVLKNAITDKSQMWNHDWPGIVTDVVAGPSGAKVLIKSEPPIKTGDKLCYDEQTEVLTASGWKRIADVTLEDNVATMDPATGVFDYIQPEDVHAYVHIGRMYHLSTSELDFMVTDNHRMLVQRRGHSDFEFMEASKAFGKRLTYKKDGTWVGAEQSVMSFPPYQYRHRWGMLTRPGIEIPMDDFLMLLGMYLSEGNVKFNERHHVYSVDITQIKPENVKLAKEALDRSSLHYVYQESSHKFVINSHHLAAYFRQFGHAWEKYIPDFVFGLSSRQQKIVFDWMMWGDGSTKKGRPVAYFTSSERLADDFQRLCLHVGYAGRKAFREHAGAVHGSIAGRAIVTQHDQYEVRVITNKLTPTINHGHVKTQHAQIEEWAEYRGKVYCCTMPKWHAIYVRRNGHACWCGNSPRFALKGVTGTVVPMDKMPRDAATNEPYDMLVNPMGFLSRIAPGQLMEIALGKVAKKTGTPFRIPQLPPPEGWLKWTQKQLADAGVSETADVFDPQTGRTIKGVGDGYMYVQAMHHLAEKKYSARGLEGGYTQDQQPAKGGETGAKKISGFDVNALLSHGATEVLKDAMTVRGQSNQEYWRRLRLGLPIQEPGVPFIYEKFLNNLKAGGINVVEKGDVTSLMPQTDKAIEELSGGRIIDSSQMVDSDMNPVKGGLFDLGKTGGAGGTRWSMIELPEPVPNPVMEEPVRRVLGLTAKKLEAVLSGKEQLNGKTGGIAVKEALENLDTGRLLEQAKANVRTKRGAERDNAVKIVGYLTAAQNMKVNPSEWMISKVPVLPPAFRPVAKMGDTALIPDTNELYKELIETKHNYELLKPELPDEALTDERLNIYKAVKAAFGLGNSVTAEGQAKNLKGPIRQIIGSVPKWGQFQSKVVAKNQDLVGRSVTVPDKNLSMDQVGIPEDMAWTMYKPFVTRGLVQRGYSPVASLQMIEDRTPTARHILDDVMKEKPVLMDRAPTWHKFNIMAFKPFIVEGKEIRVCPMIDSGFNMDHDGDFSNSPYITTFISNEILENRALTTESNLCHNPSITNPVIGGINMTKESVVVHGQKTPGAVTNLRWRDFPHYDNPTVNSHPNANFYLVPEGVCVRAYDEKTGKTVWAPVKYWSHHGVNQKLEVITVELSSGRQIITDDDPRGVYGFDPETMTFGRWRPSESIGKFVPRCIRDERQNETISVLKTDYTLRENPLCDIPLDRTSGWFFGAMVGDGWDTKDHGVSTGICFCFDRRYNNLGDSYRKAVCHALYGDGEPHMHENEQLKANDDSRYGDAMKISINSAAAGRLIDETIGHGAENKHLPPFWHDAPKEFKLGLFEGLMDTDGTLAIVKAKAKKNSQLMCNYSTISLTLATEVQYLCRVLGIDSKLTSQKTPAGNKCWQVSISTKNLKNLGLELKSSHKAKALEEAEIKSARSAGGRKYMIPVPVNEMKRVNSILLALDHPAYITANRTVKKGYVPSTIADKIAKILKATPEIVTDAWKVWLSLYDNLENVVWERVEGFTKTGMYEEGFDLTVPGYETFMNSEGVILSNTVNIHVPASAKASKEALEKMLPSRNLLSLTDMSSVRYKPEKEQVSGLWALTAGVAKKAPKVYNTKAEAIKAYRNGEVGPTDPVTIRE